MKATWIILSLIAGAFLPIQAGLNTRLGKSLESPVHASMISFVVGALAVLIYIGFTKQQVALEGFKSAPAYTWLGGVLGAFYVTVVVLAFPRIGPALTFGLIVAGQMVMAVLLDQFNILVAHQHTINAGRIIGIVLIVAGVIIVRKY